MRSLDKTPVEMISEGIVKRLFVGAYGIRPILYIVLLSASEGLFFSNC